MLAKFADLMMADVLVHSETPRNRFIMEPCFSPFKWTVQAPFGFHVSSKEGTPCHTLKLAIN